MIRFLLADLVESLRDALAVALFTVSTAWLYAPEELLA